jgi:hypothetical protein
MTARAPKVRYTHLNFPLELLRVGSPAKGSKTSTYDTVHHYTYVETSPGVLQEYTVQLPFLSSRAITLWFDEKKLNLRNPALYLHLLLHPNWSERDAQTGTPLYQQSRLGLEVESFAEKWKDAYEAQCRLLSENDRFQLMGPNFEHVNEKTHFVVDICRHPTHPKGHPLAKRADVEKSKTIATALWTQDVTRRQVRADDARKIADLMIPGTDAAIYTNFYNQLKWPNMTKQQMQMRTVKATLYEQILHFVYCSKPNANASDTNADMVVSTRILGPSVCYDLKSLGDVKIKLFDLKVQRYRQASRTHALSDEQMAQDDAEADAAADEFGFKEDQPDEDQQQQECNGNGQGSSSSSSSSSSIILTNDDADDPETYDWDMAVAAAVSELSSINLQVARIMRERDGYLAENPPDEKKAAAVAGRLKMLVWRRDRKQTEVDQLVKQAEEAARDASRSGDGDNNNTNNQIRDSNQDGDGDRDDEEEEDMAQEIANSDEGLAEYDRDMTIQRRDPYSELNATKKRRTDVR